jgi:hypothetical protein
MRMDWRFCQRVERAFEQGVEQRESAGANYTAQASDLQSAPK